MPVPPTQLFEAMVAVSKLREWLGDEDARLFIDTVEGNTNTLELLDRIAHRVLADEMLADAARERVKRIEKRAERWRSVIVQMLAQFPPPYDTSLERPLYTASVRHVAGVQITDASEIPTAMMNAPTPNKPLIKRELDKGHNVPGAVLGNAHPVLTLRKD